MHGYEFCLKCKHKDVSYKDEPCVFCIDKIKRPYYEGKKGVDKVGTAEAKKRCRDCKYSNVLFDREPCFSCLFDEGLPHFREKCEDTEGNVTRSAILTEANNIVSGHRKAGEYGPPEDSFKTIAVFWSEYLGHDIKPHDVAVMMALLKIARIKGGERKKDNWIDLAGYAACGGECQSKEE